MKYTIEFLVQQRFGKLSVLREAEPYVFPSGAKYRQMFCKCECGSETVINLYNLLSGNTKGCAECAENAPSHRLSSIPEYSVYRSMLARCLDAKDKGFANYGGRGITVEEPLLSSFEAFIAEVGRRPSDRHTLDRIDVNKNYGVGNIRWVLWDHQQHNKRKRKNSTSKFFGVSLAKNGWRAQLQQNGVRILDVVVRDEYLAAKLYDDASEKVYGDRPNRTN